jgi:hypothetical protein
MVGRCRCRDGEGLADQAMAWREESTMGKKIWSGQGEKDLSGA